MIREVDNRSKRSPLALFAGLCLVLLGGCSGLTLGSNQQQITPPTTPTNLAAAAASATQISLAWSPSTDSVAVTGYDVERCQGANCTNFAQIATTVGTTYDDTGLTPSTSYSYRVRATDGAGNLSSYSAVATAVTTAPSPTAPSNLTAVATSGTQINLSWTASTETGGTISKYLVERCQGAGCANFTQVGTSTTASYNNTGLTASTSYSYRVRATDALNNTSPYSNTASATTSGANLPTAPTNLTASATGPAQINLSWTASTELGGTIGQYLVERCQGAGCANFAQVGTTAATSYNDAGLTGSTSYTYRVRASDTSNNLGPYSTTATATTSAPVLTAPSNLNATATSSSQTNLTWTASTESGGTISGYLVERCQGAGCANFTQVGTSTTASYNNTGLTTSTSYSYRVRATDALNNTSPYSNTASATTSGANLPTAPTNLTASATGPAQINLSWTASTELGGTIAQYLVERCQGSGCANFVQVGTSTMTSYNDTGLAASTTYSYRVRATDALNNTGPYSNTANATTTGANLPTAPTNLTASATGPAQINLSWTASTELGGTIGQYLVERCQGAGCANFAQVGTTAATSYNDTGLTGSTSYTYRVRASDTSNNLGPYSTTASATTSAPVLTAPSNLNATATSSSQTNLTWTASTESGGTISGYLVERCQGAGCANFTQVGTSTTASYNNTGLTASTSYSYRVRATDALNNTSPYSNTASATTSGANLPTAPTNLTASATGPAQINLSWTASTELGGTIAQYLVERCQGSGCANFVQVGTSTMTSYNDTGLAASTTYSYRVRATDALNNTGPYSNTANATTTGANLPTAPTNLTASATGPAQINLSWTASTELGGTIGQYLVERCQGAGCANFAQVGTTAATSYNDTGLTGSTSYTYRVRASDTSNNLGPYSTTATATTSAPVLTAPSNLNATATSSSQTNLTWTASTESGGTISGYLVERCQGAGCANFTQVGTSTTASYNNTGLTASTSYSYRVRATDALNNTSPYSNTASATTSGANLPTAPTNLTASATGPAQINLSWTASTELGGTIGQYLVERCQGAGCANFAQVGTTAATSYNDAGLTGSTSYTYRVRASDTSNNLGPYSTTATATTSAPVLTAPSNLNATATSSSQTNLTWTASTESGGTISGYLVERCQGAGCANFTQVGTSTTASYNNTGLTTSTSYSYRVRATDALNNTSPYSNTASATTSGANLPTAPTNLTASATGPAQINLSWTASTELGGTIAQYLVERCQGAGCANFVQVGTSTMTSYNDTGLAASTTYSYRVRATDALNNTGPYSNTANATTTGANLPTAPTNLTASATGPAQINLSWTASTEPGGTIGQYLVERCQGAGCANFAQVGRASMTSYNDTGLAA